MERHARGEAVYGHTQWCATLCVRHDTPHPPSVSLHTHTSSPPLMTRRDEIRDCERRAAAGLLELHHHELRKNQHTPHKPPRACRPILIVNVPPRRSEEGSTRPSARLAGQLEARGAAMCPTGPARRLLARAPRSIALIQAPRFASLPSLRLWGGSEEPPRSLHVAAFLALSRVCNSNLEPPAFLTAPPPLSVRASRLCRRAHNCGRGCSRLESPGPPGRVGVRRA